MAERRATDGGRRDYVRSKVRRLRWRIRLHRGLEQGIRFLFWSLLLALGGVLAVRLLGFDTELGRPVGILLVGAALLGFLWGACRRITPFSAALAADEQLGLRERISSALSLPSSEDEMIAALHADAQRHARRLNVREAVPILLPRRARYVPMAAAALLLTLLFLPPLKVLHGDTGKKVPQVVREEVKEEAKRLEEVEKKVQAAKEIKAATAVAKLSEEIQRISQELEKQKLDRTQALAKVSSLKDTVEEQRKDILKKTDLKKSMGQMKDFEQAGDLAKALSGLDFKMAAAELQKSMEKAKQGKLSDEEKKKLAEELQSLARALKDNPELGKALSELAQKLRADDLANLDLPLDDALMSLADLGDLLEQLELLEDVLQNVSLSKLALAGQIIPCSACKSCGKCSMCGGSGVCPGCGGSGKGPNGRRCSVCQGSGLCPGCGGSGICPMCMGGVGMGYGRGIGPRPTAGDLNSSFQDQGIQGRIRPGKILAAMRVRGEQVRGESEAEITEAFLELRQNEEQAISRERIPAGMRERVGAYFDAINPNARDSRPVEVEPDAGTGQ
jgi:hypothetical protein